MTTETKLEKHVTFCPRGNHNITVRGSQAELDTVDLLINNLNPHSVGDYHILVNYNMPLQSKGSTGIAEMDLVVVDKFGVFVIEVKDWRGVIEAYDGYWLQSQKYKMENAFVSVSGKSTLLYSTWFKRGMQLADLGRVSVIGLVVLAQGKENFVKRGNLDDRLVLALAPPQALCEAVGSTRLLRGPDARMLTNEDIQRVRNTLFREHKEKDILIGDYRIVKEISPGDLFKAFEAIHVHTGTQRVRIKCYHLEDLTSASQATIAHFKRSAEAIFLLGSHPNILQTLNYFPDPDRPDVFYEVTEWVKGVRLDEVMAHSKAISLKKQLDYIEPLCAALMHAHRQEVYHRNLNPETVFITQDGTVKLADFDFAKIVGEQTIVRPNQTFVTTPMTAPEILANPSAASPASDVYSLGALWYFLANLPERPIGIQPDRIAKLKLPSSAHALMKQMLEQEVGKRPQNAKYVMERLERLRTEA